MSTAAPINIGNTGFMLLCASLVMLMTPGLAFFYGGLVAAQERPDDHDAELHVDGLDHGDVVCLRLLGCASAPTGTASSATRRPTRSCSGVTLHTMFTGNDAGIPLVVHIAYQMMFAIITPALITGAFANRVTFKAYFWFLTGWLIFVYFPFVHMLWSPDGMPWRSGACSISPAASSCTHRPASRRSRRCSTSAGAACVDNKPHNVPLIALGTGLLWFGWYGFNAGSELRVDAVTASAFLNTDVAASFAAVAWLIVEWARGRQPKFIGLLTGAVAGLATITPAAGYVSPMTAVIIGLAAGVVCYFAVAAEEPAWDGTTRSTSGACTASAASSASFCSASSHQRCGIRTVRTACCAEIRPFSASKSSRPSSAVAGRSSSPTQCCGSSTS